MAKKAQNAEAQVEITKQVSAEQPTIETQVSQIASDTSKNVSVRIRELSALGLKMGPIVKALTAAGYKTKNGTDIRFQHVRNVLNTPAKKSA